MKIRMVCQIDETKDLIIKTARRIFTQHGLFDPQMQDIAREADISRSTLYRYFQDKPDLAMMVHETMFKEIIAIVGPISSRILNREDINGLEKLELYLKKSWLSPDFEEEMKFIAEFDAYFTDSRMPDNFCTRVSAAFIVPADQTIITCLKLGIEDGTINPEIDIQLTMVTVMNALRALRQRMILRKNVSIELKKGQDKEVITELLRIIIKGIAK